MENYSFDYFFLLQNPVDGASVDMFACYYPIIIYNFFFVLPFIVNYA